LWTNYHCHSNYCDGKSNLEEYVISAIEKNFMSIGFSSHTPLPFENEWSMKESNLGNYANEIAYLKEKYQKKIEIYRSLEIDYIDQIFDKNHSILANIKLDYTIGSLHFLGQFENGKHFEIDGNTQIFVKGLEVIWQNDQDFLVTNYFESISKMIANTAPTIIGHFDKIRFHQDLNQKSIIDVYSETYQKEAIKCLTTLSKSESFLEINTRGMYKKDLSDPYPSLDLIRIANEFNIPLLLNSDSHAPAEIDSKFAALAPILIKNGVQKLKVLKEGFWIDAKLTENGLKFL